RCCRCESGMAATRSSCIATTSRTTGDAEGRSMARRAVSVVVSENPRARLYRSCSPALVRTLLGVCALIAALCPVGSEAEPPTAVTFDIPAGPLADALDRFGEQSG